MTVAGVAFVGLAVVEVLLPADDKRAQPVLEVIRRPAVIAAGAWLAAVVLTLALSAAAAFDRSILSIGSADLLAWSIQIGAGQGMLLTAAAAAVVLIAATVRLCKPALIPARAILSAALYVLISPTVTGHSASSPAYQVISVISIGVHVAAAAAWTGGLGTLLLLVAPHRGLLVAVLPRYSKLAAACIAAVLLTGLLAAGIKLGAGGEGDGPAIVQVLFQSAWGQIILIKFAALGVIGGLGWLTRRRLAASRTPLLLWAGLEVGAMAVAFGLATALTQAPTTAPTYG
jgi:putative copper resistance protein D